MCYWPEIMSYNNYYEVTAVIIITNVNTVESSKPLSYRNITSSSFKYNKSLYKALVKFED